MKVYLVRDDRRFACHLPYAGAKFVTTGQDCPSCGHPGPVQVQGKGPQDMGYDTITSDAYAACCDKRIGRLRVRMSTLFGLEEDMRVLNGRCRVY